MDTERHFFKRDISWLSFNYRVLMEAKDESLPLFERIKFLSIYSSNLEEFYRIRVSEHQKLLLDSMASNEEKTQAGETIHSINAEVERQMKEFDSFFQNDIIRELFRHHIHLSANGEVPEFHKEFIRTYFKEEIFPFLEPMLICRNQVCTFIRDNRLYIAVRAYQKPELMNNQSNLFRNISQPFYFVLKVPYRKVPRFVELPARNNTYYLMFVEDLIRRNLDMVFPGFNIDSAYYIRVSRDADFLIPDETSQTLVEEIRRNVRKRKIGDANRFVYENTMPQDFLEFLCSNLGFARQKCIPEGCHLSLEDLSRLPNPLGRALTVTLPHPSRIRDLDNSSSVFKVVKRQDVLIHPPYQNFEYFIRFLHEAAFDPDVTQIKLTQYRVAENSLVIDTLISAAQNGKQVTVFVELKARFDEENNFDTAEKMRRAGIRIIYSLPGLKVHAKMALVLRKTEKYNLEKCYACMSTGNFNEKTATTYSDIMVLTNRLELITEMDRLFDLLENGIHSYEFKYLVVSQFNMVERVKAMIDQEIENARKGLPAHIILKMNGLHDSCMINMLYDASEAGVKIELLVRGICCLIPNQPYSRNITITRIVDSYLEHSRVWYFLAGGEEKLFITSSDWMKRNLNRRIETAFPVYDPVVKATIISALKIQLRDNVKACLIDENLNNVYKTQGRYDHPLRSQQKIYELLKDTFS